MTNAELITELRGHIREVPLTLLHDAAAALKAADKRIAELEAQLPKEGEWIDLFGHDYKCSVCGEWYRMDGTPEQEDMNYCPNCGAKMRGEHDEQIH